MSSNLSENWSTKPFTVIALSNCSLPIFTSGSSSIKISINGGALTNVAEGENGWVVNGNQITLNAGDEMAIFMISDGNAGEPSGGDYNAVIQFGDTLGYGPSSYYGRYNVAGNIMSLLYGENFTMYNQLDGPYKFAYLFSKCYQLVDASNLVMPVNTAENCYKSMFNGCTSLTTAPELPATTLADQCYYSMFNGCTSLTTAPELPATTLVRSCYASMFYGCSNLNYIKAMFTTDPNLNIGRSKPCASWVYGVHSVGTFVKNSAATWTLTGVNGIPSGWSVETV